MGIEEPFTETVLDVVSLEIPSWNINTSGRSLFDDVFYVPKVKVFRTSETSPDAVVML